VRLARLGCGTLDSGVCHTGTWYYCFASIPILVVVPSRDCPLPVVRPPRRAVVSSESPLPPCTQTGLPPQSIPLKQWQYSQIAKRCDLIKTTTLFDGRFVKQEAVSCNGSPKFRVCVVLEETWCGRTGTHTQEKKKESKQEQLPQAPATIRGRLRIAHTQELLT